jgi:signal transduction histidine kinase
MPFNPFQNNKRKICTSSHSQRKNNVLITVTDNGIGIQLKDIDRIFEPKFTTKVAEWVLVLEL